LRPIDFIILGIIIAGYLLYLRLKSRQPRKKFATQGTREELNRNETEALKALQEKGYVLHVIHPEMPVTLTVDNHKQKTFLHTGNFTVRRRGRTYLVKLIKGNQTSPLASNDVRKNMLLDQLFFLPAGILVYNVDNKQWQEVHFSWGGSSSREKILLKVALILLIIAGLVVMFWYIYGGVFID